VGDVLTDVTTAKLSDPTGVYGVKRDDTDAVVVADGTAMTRTATGKYEYTFTEPAAGLSYTGYVEFVYDGNTFRFEHDLPVVSSAAVSASITYSKLKEAIGLYLGYWTNADGWTITTANQKVDIDDIIEAGLRRFYVPPPIQPAKTAHEWSFLRPVTSLVMTAETTTYDLPADYAGIEGGFSYATGEDVLYNPIHVTSEQEVRQRLIDNDSTGVPTLAGIRPKSMNYTTGTRYEVLFWLAPDENYTVYYRYRVGFQMISDANPYPPGGLEHGHTIMEACLAEAETTVPDAVGIHNARYQEFLRASIARDASLACPETLGLNVDRSDVPLNSAAVIHARTGYLVTYNGVEY